MIGELSFFDVWIIILTTISSLQIIRYSVGAINTMSKRTRFPIRLAHVILATTAAAIILCPLYSLNAPQNSEAALVAAIALLTLFDRRRSTIY